MIGKKWNCRSEKATSKTPEFNEWRVRKGNGEALSSSWAPEVAELESALGSRVGARHPITCSSGTDALLLAMMALGIGHGDEVITSPFTFIAAGEMIALLGARPVFVDIDLRTYNLDPTVIARAITSRTRAIMPVSLYGQCADQNPNLYQPELEVS